MATSSTPLGESAESAFQNVYAERDWLTVTLKSISDAVISADAEGRVTFLNPVAQTFTAWTQDDAAGRPVEDVFCVFNESNREPVDQPVRRVIEKRVNHGLPDHTVLVSRDGTQRPIDGSGAPILSARGDIIGVVLVFRDITQRRRAERAVEEDRTFFESIVDTVREPLVILDADLRVVSASRSFYRTFHVEPAETLGRFLYKLGDGQWDAPDLRMLLEGALSRNGRFDDFELTHTFPHLGKRAMLLNARKLHGAGRPAELILLAIEDVTVHKREEHAMVTSEIHYRRLFETARDGILILDTETGQIIDANPFMVELLGYSHDQFLGKELWQIGLLGDIEASRAMFRDLQAEGYVRYEHLPLVTKAGRRAEVEFVSNIYGVGNQKVIQCNIRDITERRRAETERAELLASEQEARGQAQAARARAELIQAEIEAANRAKDRFLAMLSHELRTPLTPVLLAVSAKLLEADVDPELRPTLEMIRQNIGLEARLIDDLLDVMRTIQGKMPYHFEAVDAHDLLRKTLNICQSDIQAKRIRLIEDLTALDHHVLGDPTRLQQVFWNLIKNAVKFSNLGGTLGFRSRDDDGTLVMEVIDHGLGIEADALAKIFNAFEQGGDWVTHRFGGLGLGLAISKAIAEGHGGTLTATSRGRGQGTTFELRLAALDLATAEDYASPHPPDGEPVHRSYRILLVEDDAMTSRVMSKLLRDTGYAVTTTASVAEALAVASPDVDIVVSDIGLPDGNGLDLMRELRARHGLTGIALTGYGMEDDVQRCREAGFTAHLTKPIDFANLDTMIQRVGSVRAR
jgi:PAS domain S-box-containing protein